MKQQLEILLSCRLSYIIQLVRFISINILHNYNNNFSSGFGSNWECKLSSVHYIMDYLLRVPLILLVKITPFRGKVPIPIFS